MSESLKKKIRDIARKLAEEEMSKKRGRAGIVAFGMKREHEAHGRALIDNYGLDVVGGKRRVGRPRKHRAGIIAYGMDNMMEDDDMAGERMQRKMHHRKHKGGIIAYGLDENDMDMSGERMMHHRKPMHRGRALIDTYGLEVEGGRRTYHKVGKEYVKRTRKPSAYNMHVKEFLLKHKGATISEAAAAWRNRK
jgi:hypothetical protein